MLPTFTGLSILADLIAALAVAHGASACDSTVVLATSESTVERQFYRDQSRGQLEVKQHNTTLTHTARQHSLKRPGEDRKVQNN